MGSYERPSNPNYRILSDFEATRGTSRQGYLHASYDHLASLFGEPLQGDGDKVDAQWIVETDCGIGTIYNYKDGTAWLGDSGHEVSDITFWHVGGKDEDTYRAIVEIVHGEQGANDYA